MADFDHFPSIVREASLRSDVREAIAAIYEAVQKEINTRRPLCVMSGLCCKFEEFGHRLFVTTIEVAAFIQQWPVASGQWPEGEDAEKVRKSSSQFLPLATGHSALATAAGCPFQIGKLCGVHGIRPFGCRMFFCDATATEWQNQTYEDFHARIKRLHEELSVPYFYVEWRAALRACNLL